MIITAQQVWLDFQRELNVPLNSPLFTWDAARAYSLARDQCITELYGNPAKKTSPKDDPPNVFEGDITWLDELKRRVVLTTQANGFTGLPNDLRHLLSVGAYKEYASCPNPDKPGNIVPVRYVSSAEAVTRDQNPLTSPTWDTGPVYGRYLPDYEMGTSDTVKGFFVRPYRAYTLQVEYLMEPPRFAIQNTQYELDNYGPSSPTPVAEFEYNPVNLNCVLSVRLYNQILRRMLAIWHLSKGNIQQYQLQQGAAVSGNA